MPRRRRPPVDAAMDAPSRPAACAGRSSPTSTPHPIMRLFRPDGDPRTGGLDQFFTVSAVLVLVDTHLGSGTSAAHRHAEFRAVGVLTRRWLAGYFRWQRAHAARRADRRDVGIVSFIPEVAHGVSIAAVAAFRMPGFRGPHRAGGVCRGEAGVHSGALSKRSLRGTHD